MIHIFLKLKFAFVLTLVFAAFSVAQTTLPINDILNNTEKQTKVYREEFANLLADETKTFEEFDKNGQVKEKRVIESNFLVYQSTQNADKITEYRNVIKVDGKNVGESEQRASDFFEKVLKSTTAEKELDRIRDESNRYDKTLDISGYTLYQAIFIPEKLRADFDFKLLSNQTFNGRNVFVFEYQQIKDNSFIAINDKSKKDATVNIDLGGFGKDVNGRFRGKLFIDAETFEVLYEKRETTIQPPKLSNPFVIMSAELEYQKNELNILVPKRILIEDFTFKIKGKEKNVESKKRTRLTFDYTKFTRSNVEVEGEVK